MKYPRTPHLPWSPGATADDERVIDVSHFVGREVVVTEKFDGECTTITSEGCHARSLDSGPHPSRTWVKALAGRIAHDIPQNVEIVGENVFAEHSIHYTDLPSYFLAFAVHTLNCVESASWDEMKAFVRGRGLHHAPVLYRGIWDEAKVRDCFTGKSVFGGAQEGYVVRLADPFRISDFSRSVAKFVRAGHVQTDEHWMRKPIVRNGLRPGA